MMDKITDFLQKFFSRMAIPSVRTADIGVLHRQVDKANKSLDYRKGSCCFAACMGSGISVGVQCYSVDICKHDYGRYYSDNYSVPAGIPECIGTVGTA